MLPARVTGVPTTEVCHVNRPPHRPAVTPADESRVRELLSTLPDPGPMPSDLAQRITARLDEERSTHGSVVPFPTPTRQRAPSRRFVLSLAGAAAAAAVVGVMGIQVVQDSQTSIVAAVFGGSGARAVPVHTQVSSARYTGATLARDAARLEAVTDDARSRPPASESPAIGPLGTSVGARACLDSLQIDPAGAVVDVALFESEPAAVIVSGRPGAREARVVPRSCGNGSTAVLSGPVDLP